MRQQTTDPEEALRLLEAQEDDGEKDTDLPPVTTIEIKGKDTRGRPFAGRFRYVVPNLGAQIRIGQVKALMLPQGSPSDLNAGMIVDMLGYLQVCIEFTNECPKPGWWNPSKAYDATPYSMLYRRCLDYEAKFHGRNEEPVVDGGAAEEARAPSGGGQVSVGRKVRPPAERRETLAGDDEGGA